MRKVESRIPEYELRLVPSLYRRFISFPAAIGLPLALLSLALANPVLAQATGKLNDTGAIDCANNVSNSIPCSYADSDVDGFPRQDGQLGRSAKESASGAAALSKTGSSSSPGFDFTATGTCSKDNVTGLIWEQKVTTLSNYQLNTNTYNWRSNDSNNHGGVSGNVGTGTGTTCFSSSCDTLSYIAFVNTQNICSETTDDWRLPNRAELMGIIDLSKQDTSNAAVDATFFPNIRRARYWTSDTYSANPNSARWVDLGTGEDGISDKSTKYHVILVRP